MEQVFSRTIRAGHIKETPQEHVVVADEAARAALAASFGLKGIALLRGTFVLRHERGGEIVATLDMQAKVTQTCVVTLEPFEARIAERGTLRFVPARSLPASVCVESSPTRAYADILTGGSRSSGSGHTYGFRLTRASWSGLQRSCRFAAPAAPDPWSSQSSFLAVTIIRLAPGFLINDCCPWETSPVSYAEC